MVADALEEDYSFCQFFFPPTLAQYGIAILQIF